MGVCGSKQTHIRDKPCSHVDLDDEMPPPKAHPCNRDLDDESTEGGVVRMIIIGLDYKGSESPLLEALKDAENMEALAKNCGVEDVTVITSEKATKEAVLGAIKTVGSKCSDEDIFVFYYCGHGSSLEDKTGEEADGEDEVLCTVNEKGEIDFESVTTDDELSDAITESVGESVRTLVIIDACHSGTILDLDKQEDWSGRKVVCISGCRDDQTSAGWPDMGSLLSCCIQIAIEDFQKESETTYSVAQVYNNTMEAKEERFNKDGEYPQTLCIQSSPGFSPEKMIWPLVPQTPYVSAATKAGY